MLETTGSLAHESLEQESQTPTDPWCPVMLGEQGAPCRFQSERPSLRAHGTVSWLCRSPRTCSPPDLPDEVNMDMRRFA